MGKGYRLGKQKCCMCEKEVDETWFGKCADCV
jgi:hypothetical protein